MEAGVGQGTGDVSPGCFLDKACICAYEPAQLASGLQHNNQERGRRGPTNVTNILGSRISKVYYMISETR